MPENLKNLTNDEKVLFYNKCNREVAILCNHKRTPPKTFQESMGKIDDKITKFEKEKKVLKQQLKYLKGKGPKPDPPSDDEEEEKEKKKKTPKKEGKDAKENGKGKGKKEKDDEDSDDFDAPKKKKRQLPDDQEKCKKAIERAKQSLLKWRTNKQDREGNKEVALGTSKINYMDPRITAAWCKKVGLPIEKIFNKTLQEKFPWAMDPGENWKY